MLVAAAAAAAAAALDRVCWVGEFRASHAPTHDSLVGRLSYWPAVLLAGRR